MDVLIAGRGKVGRSLAMALRANGARVRLVRGRTVGPSDVENAELVILAVPDDAITSCAHRIAGGLTAKTPVVHCAGARGLSPLDPCRAKGVPVAAMHPIASFADARRPPSLSGVTFVAQGDAAAIRAVRRMGRTIGARVAVAPVHGPAYHAAAALVANGSAALADAAVGLLVRLGLRRRDALRAVGGLLHTVAENVERVGVPQALTGPIARGDAATVRAHREALAEAEPRAARAYDQVGPVIVDTAAAAGLPAGRVRAVRQALSSRLVRRRGRRRG